MLFNDIWSRLTPDLRDTLPVTWEVTSCQHQEPLAVQFTDGANSDWVSLQVLNHNFPVLDVWIRTAEGRADDGGWEKMDSKNYNVFTTQQRVAKIDVRVDCSNKKSVVLKDSVVKGGEIVRAIQNC
jgi:expansin (peptidoglycan-binding protein)